MYSVNVLQCECMGISYSVNVWESYSVNVWESYSVNVWEYLTV